ncbi:MAG: hypothetical protein WC979_09620 [Candidatus Pacearchaeota archaeon]|jgi:hypothetical protein
MKISNFLLIFFIIISVSIRIFIIYLFVTSILLNSYLSVANVCYPKASENMEIIRLAETIVETNYTTGDKIVTINIISEDLDYTLMKHEYVHYKQAMRSFWVSMSCKAPLGKLITEIEANLAENLPDNIYIRIYGQYPKN